MTVLASAIINRVRNQLIDLGVSGPQRWTDAELLWWISDAQRTIIAALPRASATRAVMQLAVGTRQTIPAGGYALLKVYRNMGASGTAPGNAFEVIDRDMMDTQNPGWHTTAAVAAPTTIMFDNTDPTEFYVYPPSDGTGQVEVLYSQGAVDIASDSTPLVVQDIFQTPIFDYTMGRATQKDSDYAAGQATVSMYMNAFSGFLAGLTKDPVTLATQGSRPTQPTQPMQNGRP